MKTELIDQKYTLRCGGEVRFLITGGAGFIGSRLANLLAKNFDYDVIIFDNLSIETNAHKSDFKHSLIIGDVTSKSDFRRLPDNIDVVIHLAAFTNVVKSKENPEAAISANIIGTLNVLEFCRQRGITICICASTGGAIVGDYSGELNEEINPKPVSVYGASKLGAEALSHAYTASFGLKVINLRFSNVFGPGSMHKSSVVAEFMRNIIEGRNLKVFGDGTQTRDFIFIDDLCRAIILVMQKNIAGVFQIASGVETSINQLITNLSAICNKDIAQRVEFEQFRKGEVLHTTFSIDKIKMATGFFPETSLHDGLNQTWNWFTSAYSINQ